MDLITISGIALGLAMDCFAVAISTGTGTKKINRWTPVFMALLFGFFQFFMVFIGWAGGSFFKNYILNFDHWIAFLLLFLVGVKMLKEGIEKEDDAREKTDYTSVKMLLLLSFATSIDALAVGVSFSLINIRIFFPAVIIGFMSFIMTVIGFLIGKKAGEMLGKRAEILGGIILIFIGIKILIEHIK
jgi:putative Mn2+ efflux pump MntP